MRKFIAYYRVSSEEQRKGKMSLATQAEDVHGYAQRHGIRIVQEFSETHSGRWPKARPVYESALEWLRRHSEVEGIAAFRVNRLSRNMTDGSYLLEVLGKSVIVLEYGEIHPDDPGAVLTFNILLSVSAHYSSELSVRVKRGMRARMERGEFPGSRPFGFVVDSSVQPHSTKWDPERAPLIRELFEFVDRERSALDEARDWSKARGLRSRGGNTLAISEIHYILTNPAYYGMLRTEKGLIQGVHEPIVSKELFDRVQEVISRPSKRGGKAHFPFRGMLTCGECGRQLQITQIPKAGKTYRYIHCYGPKGECPRPSFREERLSDMLVSVMEGIKLTPAMDAGIRALVEEGTEAGRQNERKRLTEILALKAEIERKTQQRVTAGRKHVEGTIDATDYASIVAEIDCEIESVRERIAQLKSARPLVIGDYDGFFKLLERAPELYLRRNIEERARMLRVVASNLEVTAENVIPVYKKPFGGVAESVRSGNMWACLDSNQGPPAYQASALTD